MALISMGSLQERFQALMQQEGASSSRKWPRLVAGFIGFVLLAYGAFFLGFQTHFPGKSLVRFVQQQLANQFLVYTKIEPLELGWTQASSESVTLVKNIQGFDGGPVDLLRLENITISWLRALFTQNLKLNARAYDGSLEANWDWTGSQSLDFEIQQLRLDQIPALSLFPYALFRGSVSLKESMTDLSQLGSKSQLPTGHLTGEVADLRIKIKDLQEAVSEQYRPLLTGIQIPDLVFSKLTFDVLHGKEIEIKKIDIQGSLTGSIDGKITLKPKRWDSSRINVNITLTLAPELAKGLGGLTIPLQGYMCDKTIKLNIYGSFGRPKFKKQRC